MIKIGIKNSYFFIICLSGFVATACIANSPEKPLPAFIGSFQDTPREGQPSKGEQFKKARQLEAQTERAYMLFLTTPGTPEEEKQKHVLQKLQEQNELNKYRFKEWKKDNPVPSLLAFWSLQTAINFAELEYLRCKDIPAPRPICHVTRGDIRDDVPGAISRLVDTRSGIEASKAFAGTYNTNLATSNALPMPLQSLLKAGAGEVAVSAVLRSRWGNITPEPELTQYQTRERELAAAQPDGFLKYFGQQMAVSLALTAAQYAGLQALDSHVNLNQQQFNLVSAATNSAVTCAVYATSEQSPLKPKDPFQVDVVVQFCTKVISCFIIQNLVANAKKA